MIADFFTELQLTKDQSLVLEQLELFLNGSDQVFLLKGYAGSGKTTIIKGFVEYLDSIDRDNSIMAPTGRAAKVIRERTGKDAYTIHKSIYGFDDLVESKESESFYYQFSIRPIQNPVNHVVIVDEASLLSDMKSEGEFYRFGTGFLLSDLISYSRVKEKLVNVKIIFVGDPCQLPPVSDSHSKAFDASYLREKFGLTSVEVEMREVKRQGEGSGVMKAAGRLRKAITSGFFHDFNLSADGSDILNIEHGGFLHQWRITQGARIIIASKNKTCQRLNQEVRKLKFGQPNLPIQRGDIIILGANNYPKGVFNGEFAVVNEVSPNLEIREIALRGKPPVKLSWRDIELIFPESEEGRRSVRGKILENFLYGDNFLQPNETQALFVDFLKRYPGLEPSSEAFRDAIMKDDYFNSLMIKFGYAVTCHKAQGGEWEHVFTIWDHENKVDFDYLKDKQPRKGRDNELFFRWAYTAVTRSSHYLYTLNPPQFNCYSFLSFYDIVVIEALAELTGSPAEMIEIDLSGALMTSLREKGLMDQPIQLQDHFIQVDRAMSQKGYELIGWKRNEYEIHYFIRYGEVQVGVKTWFNGEFKFKGKFMQIPMVGGSLEVYKEIESELLSMNRINVIRDNPDVITDRIEFDYSIEEQFPFTTTLFGDIVNLLSSTGIEICEIRHLHYHERYTFIRGTEKAVINFEYNGEGFFGRIFPLMGQSNSNTFLLDLRTILLKLKTD